MKRIILLMLLFIPCIFSLDVSVSKTLIENDFYDKNDDHYTGGIFLGRTTELLDTYDGAGWLGATLGLDQLLDREHKYVTYNFQYKMFTPEELEYDYVPAGDMNYAAMFALGTSLVTYDIQTMDAISFHLGYVGPYAYGEEIQSEIHRMVNDELPMGWDNQTEEEILFNITFERRTALLDFSVGDVLLSGSLSIGNMVTRAQAGGVLRLGRVPNDHYMLAPFYGDDMVGYHLNDYSSSLYFMTGVDVGVYKHAVHLNGTAFRDSYSSIDEPYYEIIRTYSGFKFGDRKFQFELLAIYETVPFNTPDGREWEGYGRAGMTVTF